jgi:hypothetical protein
MSEMELMMRESQSDLEKKIEKQVVKKKQKKVKSDWSWWAYDSSQICFVVNTCG